MKWMLVACALALACDHPTASDPDADILALPSPTPSLSPTPSPSPTPTPLPTPSLSPTLPPDAGLPCGPKPLPDCPLQGWMKRNMNPPMNAHDWQGIASALERAATFAPPGYTNWVSIAKDGANAARAAELDAVKAACRGCHEQYKNKYRAEMRARVITEPP